jgi:hypothetical protein
MKKVYPGAALMLLSALGLCSHDEQKEGARELLRVRKFVKQWQRIVER